jgi:hypothetical protein
LKTLLRYCFILISILTYSNVSAKAVALSHTGSDATLKSIVLSTATSLFYTTGPSDYNYTTSVSPGTPTLTVDPTTNDPLATVTVNGTPVSSGTQSSAITLNGIVTTTINMLVTASDGVTTHSYSIVVYETGSNNAFLSALSVSTGTALVSSSTGPGAFNYTTSVSSATTSLTVTPTTADPTATVQVNGVSVTSGSASGSIPLNPTGTTTINTVVTAQDGTTTQTYSIIVSKTGSNVATLSALSVSTNTVLISSTGSSNVNYVTSVSAGTASLTVTPTTTDPNATVTVNGTQVISGTASGSITLAAAPGTTTINVLVTAQDGSTKESYSITVSKNASSNASLSSITLSTGNGLTSSSGSSNVNYTTSVSPTITSLTVTPTAADLNAIITINGVVVTSGTASGAIALNTYPATTTINILVTAQDGSTTKSTAIVVSNNGSNNANASSITLSPTSTLISSSGSNPNYVYYTASVSSGPVTVTTTTADATATITVNGVAVASGNASGSITLSAQTNPINVVITAEDKVTTKTYVITVTTTGSNNANSNSITLSTGSMVSSPSNPNNYNAFVSKGTANLTVTVTPSDLNATVTVNGTVNPSGAGVYPASIALNAYPATTTINILITAQDGATTKSFIITVSETGSSNAGISSLTLSTGTSRSNITGTSTLNYATSVSPHTTSMTVTTVLQDPTATITVNGFAVANGAPSNPLPLNAYPATTLINIVVTAQDGHTKLTVSYTVSKTGASIVWTGASTTALSGTTIADWKNAGNWNPAQVPGPSDVASIGETAFTGTNQPTISSNLTIGEVVFGQYNSPTLTVSAGNKLTVGTSLTVNASSAAIVAGAIDISPGATLNVTGNGKLTINTSKFTLKSNSAGSASVGQITSGSIIGNAVNVERYITGGSTVYRGYRLLSSPVHAGADAYGNYIYSINYVKLKSLLTGTTGIAGGFDKTGNPTLYLFRENIAASLSFTGGNYRGVNDIITHPPSYSIDNDGPGFNIPVGNGFKFFFRGNRTNAAAKYFATTIAESDTLTATGTLNIGQFTVHDWYTPNSANLGYTNTPGNISARGFNLVGNPYPSSIDWDTFNQTTPNSGIYAPGVGTSIYITDPVSKNYGVYMANSGLPGTNNATHIIPSGQGFYLLAQSTGASLTFNEDAKTTVQVTGPALLLGKPVATTVTQYLHLKLSQKLSQDSVQADEIYIRFNNSATSKFLVNEDAAQMQGFGIASLASMSSDGVSLSINTLKLPQQNAAIALNVNAVNDGAYQLSMPDVKSIPALFDIWLVDAYKKDSIDIRNNAVYNFNIINSDSASYGSKRFSLVMHQNPSLALRLLNFTAAKVTNGAQIVWKTVNEENYTNFTVERSTDDGKTFDVLGGLQSSGLGTYSFFDKAPSMAANQYRLKLEDFNGNISYSKVITLLYSNLSNSLTIKTVSVYPNPASNVINLSIAPNSSSTSDSSVLQTTDLIQANNSGPLYDIKIISISGTVIKTTTSSQPNWQGNVSNLLPGTYIILVQNSNDKSLVGKNMFVKL